MRDQNKQRHFYSALCGIALFLCVILFALLIVFRDSSLTTLVISASISILGGALASVIVAWLIDYEKVQTEKQNREKIRSKILLPAYNTIIVAFLNFARLSNLMNSAVGGSEDKRNIQNWMEQFTVELSEYSVLNSEAKNQCLISLSAVCNNTHNRIVDIKENRIQLIVHDLIEESEYYALCSLKLYFDKIYHSIEGKNTGKIVAALSELSQNISNILPFIAMEFLTLDMNFDSTTMSRFLQNTGGLTYIPYREL